MHTQEIFHMRKHTLNGRNIIVFYFSLSKQLCIRSKVSNKGTKQSKTKNKNKKIANSVET